MASENDIDEMDGLGAQLNERLRRQADTPSWQRHLALAILALTAVGIYAGWRIKHPEIAVSPEKTPHSASVKLSGLSNQMQTFINDTPSEIEKLPEVRPLPPLTQSMTVAEKSAGREIIPSAANSAALAENSAPLDNSAESNAGLSGANLSGEPRIPESAEDLPPSAPAAETFQALPLAENVPDTDFSRPAEKTPKTHLIAENDSLPEIAAKYYGSDSPENIMRLRNANPALKNGGFRAGTRLIIPELPAGRNCPPAAGDNNPRENASLFVRPAENAPADMRSYIVRPGDTLSRIATRIYGRPADWKKIYAANRDRLTNPGNLPGGLELRLP